MTLPFRPLRTVLFPALVLVALLPVAAMADAPPRTISVSGDGLVEIKPDMATLQIGVRHQAPTAREALDLMSAGLGPVIARLRDAGIADADIQTGALGLNQIYEYPDNAPPRVTGIEAYSTVTVRVRDIARVGSVLDGVVDDGANSLGGISFGLEDLAAALDEARAQAVADARARAEIYAAAAGVALGDVLSISEAGSYGPPLSGYEMRMDMAPAAVPVAPGEVSISASVSVVYEIAD